MTDDIYDKVIEAADWQPMTCKHLSTPPIDEIRRWHYDKKRYRGIRGFRVL
jgi:hypothetical protein